ncbi:hypothetical protein [Thermogemmatispora onikobensis]|uniref:hypothetical protein n=1 Tax=Thermogemmatispora onikobensis TaxID=732234 RepID=UPI00114CDD09|nr:hypothetical protein [Thermogemmatispora onikobensis]
MSKVKMRCINCGKRFQSVNAKDALCPECNQKSRREKQVTKTGPQRPVSAPRPVPPPPRPPSSPGGTNHWLDHLQDIKVSEPEPPARFRSPQGPASRFPAETRPPGREGPRPRAAERPLRAERERERERDWPGPRGPAQYWEAERRGPLFRGGYSTLGQRPRSPVESGPARGPRQSGPFSRSTGAAAGFGFGPSGKGSTRPGSGQASHHHPHPHHRQAKEPAKAAKPLPQPVKPKHEKTPPPAPFVPTPEQVALVEARYKELAQPVEFDGIRTRIAHELSIPKSAVKKIVKALREREGLPSWWEVQPYRGNSEELAKIRALYEPFLPVPPIGVHRTIAQQLSLKPAVVYQAIRLIRQELKLPQYNDPSLHTQELTTGVQAGDNKQAVPVLPAGTMVTSPTPEIVSLSRESTGSGSVEATPHATESQPVSEE